MKAFKFKTDGKNLFVKGIFDDYGDILNGTVTIGFDLHSGFDGMKTTRNFGTRTDQVSESMPWRSACRILRDNGVFAASRPWPGAGFTGLGNDRTREIQWAEPGIWHDFFVPERKDVVESL